MRPIVALHGYGAGPRAFDAWRTRLALLGRRESYAAHYRTQSDDVTLHDLAEGLDRALALHPALGSGRPFDALVHSTGMLVLRAWLAARPERLARLGSVVALAPATFGSPLAHVGRGMLGALFAGDKRLGPDFLEAGDRVLASLELASAETWKLAAQPLPRTLVACGTSGYPFPLNLAHPEGSDGVVRFAGCAADAPETIVDLRRNGPSGERVQRAVPGADALPTVPVPGRNHATLLCDPPSDLAGLVAAFLAAETEEENEAVRRRVCEAGRVATRSDAATGETRSSELGSDARDDDPCPTNFRQWIVRVEDERGDAVPDYYLDLLVRPDGAHRWRRLAEVHPTARLRAHVHRDDRSRRCFHLDLAAAPLIGRPLALRLLAESGSDRVGYAGHCADLDVEEATVTNDWTAVVALGTLQAGATTERLRLIVDRDPLPPSGRNRLVDVAVAG